ncbi:hypothetical protein [Aquabacterium sp.]|uniref:hypothetical protein n=1 Tax=Aquabacterium sp. TaxID=1872578 RepID=UPI002E369C77|nr:hypothetical protein [Aquabacterium sp.]HEX5311974.1 hypothetical protein [Aquabacterium sp.]
MYSVQPRISPLVATLLMALTLPMGLSQAASLSKGDYETRKDRITADYKIEKAACDSHSGNAKDVCVEEAKAKEKVAKAELEYAYTGKAADRNKVLVVKAETAYDVAKERCDDKAGNAKDLCVEEAKATKTKALADAKLGKEMQESRKDASKDKQDADYKVAVEKCDAMAGDAKANCMAVAKAKFGKN